MQKKVISLTVLMLVIVSSLCNVFAFELKRSDSDQKYVDTSLSSLFHMTTLEVKTPVLTECSVKSVGSSDFYFATRSSGYRSKVTSRTLNVTSGGIGATSVSLGGNYALLSSKENNKTWDMGTSDYKYTVH